MDNQAPPHSTRTPLASATSTSLSDAVSTSAIVSPSCTTSPSRLGNLSTSSSVTVPYPSLRCGSTMPSMATTNGGCEVQSAIAGTPTVATRAGLSLANWAAGSIGMERGAHWLE